MVMMGSRARRCSGVATWFFGLWGSRGEGRRGLVIAAIEFGAIRVSASNDDRLSTGSVETCLDSQQNLTIISMSSFIRPPRPPRHLDVNPLLASVRSRKRPSAACAMAGPPTSPAAPSSPTSPHAACTTAPRFALLYR